MKRILLLVFLILAACQPVPNLETAVPATSPSIPVTQLPATITPNPPTTVPTIPASVNELDGAELQPGFSLIKYADLPRPTAFAFDAAGRLYATSQDGNVYLLSDSNQDGRADTRSIFASGYDFPLGVAVQGSTGEVYISQKGVLSVLSDGNQDGVADNVGLKLTAEEVVELAQHAAEFFIPGRQFC